MIKVQPSYSRIVWSQSPDRITLRMPRTGLFGLGGMAALCGLALVGISTFLVSTAIRHGAREFAAVAAIAGVPGILALFGGLSGVLRSWSFERDASRLTFRRGGLLGTRERHWPVADIASLYVNEEASGTDMADAILKLAFRNGRSEEVLHSRSGEELRWVAAMLIDSRGERKPTTTMHLAAEPERRKVDPEIVPATLACRAFEGGVEVTFVPLLRSKGLWWRLPLAALLGTVAIVGVSLALYRATRGGFPLAVPRIGIAVLLGTAAWRIWVLRRWAVVRLLDGMVTVRQGSGHELLEFGAAEVEFVQTFRRGRHTELQFLLRGKPKVCLLDGRPPLELEWAARFLRVALKGRTPVPENAPLKVDATAGECPVCLERMEGRVVYCATCSTPAHEECWSYLGMCATYGCRDIRFTRTPPSPAG